MRLSMRVAKYHGRTVEIRNPHRLRVVIAIIEFLYYLRMSINCSILLSSVYLYQLQAGHYIVVMKFVLLRKICLMTYSH